MAANSSISLDPFRDNPFRVLGLPGEAPWPEITRVAERLRGLESWGTYRTAWDLPWLHPVRREPSHIAAALARLSDVDFRLHDRLFWFQERDAENAVAYLSAASIRDAIEGWAATSLAVARHDAAVVALLASLSLDPRVEDPTLWRRTLAQWKGAIERDEYWLAILKTEAEGEFDPPATLGALTDLREDALRLVASTMMERAWAALVVGDAAALNRAFAVLRDALPSALVESLQEEFRPRAERAVLAAEPPARLEPAAPPAELEPDVPPTELEPAVPPEQRRREVIKQLSRLRTGPAPLTPVEPPPKHPVQAVPPRPIEPPPLPPTAPAPPPLAESVAPVEAPEPPIEAAAPVEAPEPPIEAAAATEAPPPAEAPAPPAEAQPETPGVARPRRWARPVLLTALAAAAVVVALFLLPGSEPGEGRAPEPTDRRLLALATHLDASDDAIVQLLLDRSENQREKLFVERRARGYGELIADYEWRIANGLTYDPAALARVRSARQEALDRHRLATERQRIFSERYDRLIRGHQRLISEYNERVR